MNSVGRVISLLALVLSTAIPAVSAQRIHTVADGQTLGGIAKRYGITVAELREANRLAQGTALKLGQRLLVPSPGEMAKVRKLIAAKATGPAATTDVTTEAPAAVDEPAAVAETPLPAPGDGTAAPSEPAAEIAGAADSVAPEPEVGADVPAPAGVPQNAAARPKVVTAAKARRTENVDRRRHVVASGHTLAKIAKRYRIKVESLCDANGLDEHAKLRVGQKLVVPNDDSDPIIALGPAPGDEPSVRDSDPLVNRNPNALKELSVPGAGPVYYYEPTGKGRHSMRPIVVYLHGRGGDAQADCRRWSRVARRFGWLVCPSGPTPHNSGRSWNNNWVSGQQAVMGSIQALRNLYGRRVQLYGNTLVGFSEGAYVAMNVGVRQPHTFNRWLILGADVSYWGGSGLEALKDAKSQVKRVVLITGGRDQVVDDTRTVAGWLEDKGVPLRIQTPGDLAHEVAIERKPELYVSALHWLDNGGPQGKRLSQAKRR